MLVLTRQLNESIIIDETIEVYVVGLSPESVELVMLGLPDEQVRKITLLKDDVVNVVENVVITLVDAREDKSRLGIDAPRGTSIQRGQMPD